eukprot:1894806-Alexandrium_andersonii.AAC.1
MCGGRALTPSSKHAVHGCTHAACHVVCGTAARGCAGCHFVLSHEGALHAVDAQCCMPHTQAASEVAR